MGLDSVAFCCCFDLHYFSLLCAKNVDLFGSACYIFLCLLVAGLLNAFAGICFMRCAVYCVATEKADAFDGDTIICLASASPSLRSPF